MQINIPVPNWIGALLRRAFPKLHDDLDRRSTLTGKASKEIVTGKMLSVTVSADTNGRKQP